jgi:hypothetical protein
VQFGFRRENIIYCNQIQACTYHGIEKEVQDVFWKGGVNMVDGLAAGNVYGGSNFDLLEDSIGETVTIFTTSGGDSGSGFTGVVLSVNRCFVRLITHIGPAPGCALGSCCGIPGYGGGGYGGGGYGGNGYGGNGYGGGYNAGGGGYVNTVGSVTDIPLDRIAAVVRNAV